MKNVSVYSFLYIPYAYFFIKLAFGNLHKGTYFEKNILFNSLCNWFGKYTHSSQVCLAFCG